MRLEDLQNNKNVKIIHSLKLETKVLSEGTNAIFIIPDMHLHTKGSSDFFKENEEKFLSLLKYFEILKKDNGKKIKFFQLGDMFELWVEPISVKKIKNAYIEVISKMDNLGFKYVFGNHDYELSKLVKRKKHKYKKRRFCRWSGKVYFEHGYMPDFIVMPSLWFIKRIGVSIGRIAQRIYCKIANLFLPRHKRRKPKEDIELFANFLYLFNHIRRKKYYEMYEKNYAGRIDFYLNHIKNINKKDFRVAVVAHTHKPHLVKTDDNYYYMDCGAFCNQNRNFGVILEKEIAICNFE